MPSSSSKPPGEVSKKKPPKTIPPVTRPSRPTRPPNSTSAQDTAQAPSLPTASSQTHHSPSSHTSFSSPKRQHGQASSVVTPGASSPSVSTTTRTTQSAASSSPASSVTMSATDLLQAPKTVTSTPSTFTLYNLVHARDAHRSLFSKMRPMNYSNLDAAQEVQNDPNLYPKIRKVIRAQIIVRDLPTPTIKALSAITPTTIEYFLDLVQRRLLALYGSAILPDHYNLPDFVPFRFTKIKAGDKDVSTTNPIYHFTILLTPSQDYEEFAFNALCDTLVSAGGAGITTPDLYPDCYDSVLFPTDPACTPFSATSATHGLAYGTRLGYASVNNLSHADKAICYGLSPARINRNDGSHRALFHSLYESFGGASLTGALANTGPDDLNKHIGVREGILGGRVPILMLSAASTPIFQDFYAQALDYRNRQGKRHFTANKCKWNIAMLPTNDRDKKNSITRAIDINKAFNKDHVTLTLPTAPLTTQAQHDAVRQMKDLCFYLPVHEGFDCWQPTKGYILIEDPNKRRSASDAAENSNRRYIPGSVMTRFTWKNTPSTLLYYRRELHEILPACILPPNPNATDPSSIEVIDLTHDQKLPALPSNRDVLESWDIDSSDPESDFNSQHPSNTFSPSSESQFPPLTQSMNSPPASPKRPHPPSDSDSRDDPQDDPMETSSHDGGISNATTTLDRSRSPSPALLDLTQSSQPTHSAQTTNATQPTSSSRPPSKRSKPSPSQVVDLTTPSTSPTASQQPPKRAQSHANGASHQSSSNPNPPDSIHSDSPVFFEDSQEIAERFREAGERLRQEPDFPHEWTNTTNTTTQEQTQDNDPDTYPNTNRFAALGSASSDNESQDNSVSALATALSQTSCVEVHSYIDDTMLHVQDSPTAPVRAIDIHHPVLTQQNATDGHNEPVTLPSDDHNEPVTLSSEQHPDHATQSQASHDTASSVRDRDAVDAVYNIFDTLMPADVAELYSAVLDNNFARTDVSFTIAAAYNLVARLNVVHNEIPYNSPDPRPNRNSPASNSIIHGAILRLLPLPAYAPLLRYYINNRNLSAPQASALATSWRNIDRRTIALIAPPNPQSADETDVHTQPARG